MHVPGVVRSEFRRPGHRRGRGRRGHPLGVHVAVAPIEYCGSCWSCTHGHPNTCRVAALYGGYRRPLHGGLAARVAVSRRCAFVIPDGLGVVEAALAEPVAVAVHAVRQAPMFSGRPCLFSAPVPLVLPSWPRFRARGRRRDRQRTITPARRRRRSAGCRHGHRFHRPRFGPAHQGAVGAEGVDIVFDTTVVSAAFNNGIRALRPRGTMVSVAGWQEQAGVEMGFAMAKETAVRFTMTYQPEVDFRWPCDCWPRGLPTRAC